MKSPPFSLPLPTQPRRKRTKRGVGRSVKEKKERRDLGRRRRVVIGNFSSIPAPSVSFWRAEEGAKGKKGGSRRKMAADDEGGSMHVRTAEERSESKVGKQDGCFVGALSLLARGASLPFAN